MRMNALVMENGDRSARKLLRSPGGLLKGKGSGNGLEAIKV